MSLGEQMSEQSGNTLSRVAISEITVPEGRMRRNLRDPSPLAESLREIGLLHPITITGENVLVAGLHRLRAAELLGWETIEARTASGGHLDAELAEIDENLLSNRLTRAEEAHHIARREEIMQARGERATASPGTNQHRGEVPATVAGTSPKTTAALAKESGMSERTYRDRARIGRKLTDETLEIISELDPNDSDLPNSTRQLNYLSGVDDPEHQSEIARRVATGEAVSVWQASEQLKGERDVEANGGDGGDGGNSGPWDSDSVFGMYAARAPQGLPQGTPEGKEGDDEDLNEVVEIRRMQRGPEFSVRFADGQTGVVPRAVLEEAGWSRCKHCSGRGINKKEK